MVVVLGGRGSAPGVVVGALVVAGCPRRCASVEQWRMVIFALLLVVMMLVRPQGLWPAPRIRRDPFAELAEEEADAAEPAAAEPVGGAALGEPDALLTVEELTCRFGGVTAVDRLSLECGAARSSASSAPTGPARPPPSTASPASRAGTGTMRFDGPPGARAGRRTASSRLGIARTFQDVRLFGEMPASRTC